MNKDLKDFEPTDNKDDIITNHSNSFKLFSKTNDGHSFCNKQRFEDLKDFEPTSTTKTVCERFM